MLFLKRLETFGFKSFADATVINFEYEMTGVVGPNGSGKSNINDAIRWTLGEQSIKSLRGNNNDDVIFNGTENKSALNMAEVKLTFDNTTRIFDIDYDEVQITRRVFRGSGENEYFINNTKVRLKDVQDLALDTGLTKSSLAIISQGNVSAFAEAKPQDRRLLFEEAAGVAKYKKRKLESIRKLEKTSENLNRLRDIVNEIERKLPSLKRQSEKATIYNEKKTKLNAIELAILVKDVNFYNEKLQELKENKRILTDQKNDIDREIADKENEYNQTSKQNYELDKSINALNKEFTNIVSEIGNLLSGGEKSLVALSVLFAILKARPIPLVILDEAEAPLDPANVERFAKYIKSFIDTTQFIIVTHRIGTMENCDVLYGATMQKKGITKIVGIQLLQAKQLVEKLNNNENASLQSAV